MSCGIAIDHTITARSSQGLRSYSANMKSLTALCWASAIAQVCSATPRAHVYVSDSKRHNTKPCSISIDKARSLFAQRLGLSNYHNLGDVSDSTLDLLSEHGGRQLPLLSDKMDEEHTHRLLAIVEGIEHQEGISNRDSCYLSLLLNHTQ